LHRGCLFSDHGPVDLAALVGWLSIGAGLIWLMRRRRDLLTRCQAERDGGPSRDDSAATEPGGRPSVA
jgi:hypothetical protein